MNKGNFGVIAAMLVSTVAISGSLIFVGMQMSERGGGVQNLQASIESGIDEYVKKMQEEAEKAQAAVPDKRVEGDFMDDDAILGNPDAPVQIVEFSDYQCPFCRKFYNETLPLIKKNYIDTGKALLVYRDLPLSFHSEAKPAAMAAECARDQGGDKTYYDYHDLIFEGQNKLGQGTVAIPAESLPIYAKELGLDVSKFNECLKSEKFDEEVQNDIKVAGSIGINGTPGFVINGRIIPGAMPYEIFEEVIEEALSNS